MTSRETIAVTAEDVWGQFNWKLRPICSCGELAKAVEAKLVFVSKQTRDVGGSKANTFYVLPVGGDGFFALDEGMTIHCCPWCGDQIIGLRT